MDGFVFKKDSPSCGTSRVRLYNPEGPSNRKGVGIFAQTFTTRFPLIPVEEEGRLIDHNIRDNFIERVFCYNRWRQLVEQKLTRRAILIFHQQHRLLLLSHSQSHFHKLNRLVAQDKELTLRELTHSYIQVFMDAIKVKSTIRKHGKVLDHMMSRLTPSLLPAQQKALYRSIEEYREGLIPLRVPRMLIREYVRMLEIDDLREEIYLYPQPQEETLGIGSDD